MKKFTAVPGKGIYAAEDAQVDKKRLEDDADVVFDYTGKMLTEVGRLLAKLPDEDIADALHAAKNLQAILQRVLSDYTKRLKGGE